MLIIVKKTFLSSLFLFSYCLFAAEKESILIIGCGHSEKLEAYKPPSAGVHKNDWKKSIENPQDRGCHKHEGCTTWDITRELSPDRVCDITQMKITPDMEEQFDVVYLEKLPPQEVLNNPDTYKNIYKILKPRGKLIIDNSVAARFADFSDLEDLRKHCNRQFIIHQDAPFSLFINTNPQVYSAFNKLSPETRGKINEKFVKEFLSKFGFSFSEYTLHQKENPNPFNQRVNSPVYEFQKAPIFLSYKEVIAKIRKNTEKRTKEAACLRIQRFVRNKK
jgi:hypothetical protein